MKVLLKEQRRMLDVIFKKISTEIRELKRKLQSTKGKLDYEFEGMLGKFPNIPDNEEFRHHFYCCASDDYANLCRKINELQSDLKNISLMLGREKYS